MFLSQKMYKNLLSEVRTARSMADKALYQIGLHEKLGENLEKRIDTINETIGVSPEVTDYLEDAFAVFWSSNPKEVKKPKTLWDTLEKFMEKMGYTAEQQVAETKIVKAKKGKK